MRGILGTYMELKLLLISWIVARTCGCIDGSNMNMGAVVEPYKENSKESSGRTESEISSMVSILSQKFTRVSLYANNDPTSIDSGILLEVAKYNSKQHIERKIEVIAALQSSDQLSFERELNSLLRKVEDSNRIHARTVSGLIVTSSYFEMLNDIRKLRFYKFYSSGVAENNFQVAALGAGSVNELYRTMETPLKKLVEVSNLIKIAKSRLNGTYLEVGFRSGNCVDLEDKAFLFADAAKRIILIDSNSFDGLSYNLDFVVCRQLPPILMTPKESAAILIAKMDRILKIFNDRWPTLKVIMETGWPTDGTATSGVEGSVSAMHQFWCEIDQWSKNNSVKVDFYTAFDGIRDASKASECNYGWWIRTQDEVTGLPTFVEKINYTPPGNQTKRSTVLIVLLVLGGFIIIPLCIILAYFKVKSSMNQFLTTQEIENFMKGYEGFQADEFETENVQRLPYDSAYELLKKRLHIDENHLLGKGEFGLVFGGRIDGNEKNVAFKVTNPDCTATSLKSLLSEIKILIHVGSHTNVVSIIGAYTGEINRGKVVIAFELCENGSLEKYLKLQKARVGEGICSVIGDIHGLSSDENKTSEELVRKLVQLSYEISLGMEHIAGRNIIHADLAARNVLLTADGTAKITDFGLSKRLYEYQNYVKKNQEPMPWRWMALETLEQLTFSTKSDVWSYGVTLFEIFSLCDTPYPDFSWNQNFTKLLREGLRLEKPSFAPQAIHELMKNCFLIDPKQRPTFTEIKNSYLRMYPDLKNNEDLSLTG